MTETEADYWDALALYWLYAKHNASIRYLVYVTGYGIPRVQRLIELGRAVSEAATIH